MIAVGTGLTALTMKWLRKLGLRTLPLPPFAFRRGEVGRVVDVSRAVLDDGVRFALAPSSPPLPEGLALSLDGQISGTPMASVGPRTVIVRGTSPAGIADMPLRLSVDGDITARAELEGDALRVVLTGFGAPDATGLRLRALELDGAPLPEGALPGLGPELATRPSPGRRKTRGGAISGFSEKPVVGATYLVSYEIVEDHGSENLYLSDPAGGPFRSRNLSRTPGVHHVVVTAKDEDDDALMRLVGDVTFGFVSCRRADWTIRLPQAPGDSVFWRLGTEREQTVGALHVPEPGLLYVSEAGAADGNGAALSPFRQPAEASAAARPGDRVVLRPGRYEPFEVAASGTAEAPITFTTLPGEAHLAVIDGSGRPERGGVMLRGRDHVTVENIHIRGHPPEGPLGGISDGVYVEGVAGERHGHHVFRNLRIDHVRNSGIFVCGYFMDVVRATADVRTVDILIEGCDISETNHPSGVNEAISVGGGVDGVVTRDCDIHDTDQYGIDYKLGVRNGVIEGNRIWNVERYGIYMDVAQRYVEDVVIRDNVVWNCDLGIVFAREAGAGDTDAAGEPRNQTLARVDCFNNVVHGCNTGLYCHAHPHDTAHGTIEDIRIRFNTIYDCGLHRGPRGGGTGGDEVRLVGWDRAAWIAEGIARRVDVVGNVIWRDPSRGAPDFVDNYRGDPGFRLEGNVTADPLFVDAAGGDFRLRAGSPAIGAVSAADAAAPFDADRDGGDRTAHRAAGAHGPGDA